MANDSVAGHTMTSIEDGGAASGAKGGDHGAENAADPQDNTALHEQTGNENLDAREEAGADGEALDHSEGEVGEEKGDTEGGDPAEVEPEPFDPKKFEEGLLEKLEKKLAPPPQPPKQLTEEEWVAKEQEFGASRQTIQAFTNQSMKVYNAVRDYVDEQFAAIHKDTAMRSIAQEKGYTDAMRYRKEVDKFLSQYHPKHHSNPELIKMGVIYGRGLAASKNIQRARTDGERNRRITGTARPSSPAAQGRRSTAPVALTRDQKEAASKFNMSESEYAGLLKKRGTPVAV